MSLIHYIKPFLDLGICKEYSMARKTTGNGVTDRSKRTETPLQPVEMRSASDISAEVSNQDRKNEDRQEVRNGKPANNPVPINQNSINQNSMNQSAANQGPNSANLEEEIRHRAYDLYLERRANGGDAGDPHQDWLTAEREILSRRNSPDRKSA
jgi:Protein of unknown function (DUF2934)